MVWKTGRFAPATLASRVGHFGYGSERLAHIVALNFVRNVYVSHLVGILRFLAKNRLTGARGVV